MVDVLVEPNEDAKRIREYIRENPDIRKEKYSDPEDALLGSCYVASEAYFHLMGGTDSNLDIYCLSWQDVNPEYDGTHWFLRDGDTIIDISLPNPEEGENVPWDVARKRAFLTGYEPSRRCEKLLDAISAE